MKIPNADRAFIDETKLRDYLLSSAHPIGRFKAAFFASMGYWRQNWHDLDRDLRAQHLAEDAKSGQPSIHGTKYEIHAEMRGPSGRIARVVSVWIVLTDDDVPRFLTAFPGSE